MAILSVGIVGAMRVFPVGLRASQRAELNSRAAIAAKRTIESLKLKSWEALAEGTSSSTEGEFEVTTTVMQPAVEHLVDPTRLKTIQVTVQWTQDGRDRSLTFLTYLRKETTL